MCHVVAFERLARVLVESSVGPREAPKPTTSSLRARAHQTRISNHPPTDTTRNNARTRTRRPGHRHSGLLLAAAATASEGGVRRVLLICAKPRTRTKPFWRKTGVLRSKTGVLRSETCKQAPGFCAARAAIERHFKAIFVFWR